MIGIPQPKLNVTTQWLILPDDLPEPIDDGAAAHLPRSTLPDLAFKATNGADVNIGELRGTTVIYLYPMTGRPDIPLPKGWDSIPGARGCTPQSCSFRDHYAELLQLRTRVYGLSAQTSHDQREAQARLHLPFPLLSDPGLSLAKAIGLPTFTVSGLELYRRLTLIAEDARIEKVFYPVFPPDSNAEQVLAWLSKRRQ